LGRDERENALIQKNARQGDLFIEPKNFKGPVALVRGKNNKLSQKKVEDLIKNFSKKTPPRCEYNCYNL
jgi:predicted ribosome quality control (RQC) complex YloA/Tae2 family protein